MILIGCFQEMDLFCTASVQENYETSLLHIFLSCVLRIRIPTECNLCSHSFSIVEIIGILSVKALLVSESNSELVEHLVQIWMSRCNSSSISRNIKTFSK